MKLQLAILNVIVLFILCCSVVKRDDSLAGLLGLVMLVLMIIIDVKAILAWKRTR